MQKSTWAIIFFYTFALYFLVIGILFDANVAVLFLGMQNLYLDIFMLIFDFLGKFYIIIIIASIIILLYDKRKLIESWIALGLSGIFVYVLKEIVQRARPSDLYGFSSVIESTSSGFPSGHATLAISVLPLFYSIDKGLFYSWLVFAFIIVLSRLYLGLHYLSDVAFGVLLGFSIGLIVRNIAMKRESRKD